METFKENGSYNKTNWEIGDIITTERLNKIEDALYEINESSNDVNKLDLSNYVTKSEMPTNVSDFINDAGYVTRSHTHTNYATKAELNDAIANIKPQDVDLSNYATKAELNNKADSVHTHSEYLTEHQSLENYATKTYVDDAIENIDIPETNNNYITSNNITRIEVVTEYPDTEETGVLYIKVSE